MIAKPRALTAVFSVTSQLEARDFADIALAGFASVINFRPDHEAVGQLINASAERYATEAGLQFRSIATSKFDVFADEIVSQTSAALAALPHPILGYCGSGQRAALVWAAAMARTTPVDTVLSLLRGGGLEFEFVRDDLEVQADRMRWAETGNTSNQFSTSASAGNLRDAA